MSYSNIQGSCDPQNPCCNTDAVDCGEESVADILCRHEKYIDELFKRTRDLSDQLTGEGIGPLKIVFTSDQGEAGALQDNLAASMIAANPDVALFCGDNNYEDGSDLTIEANWAALDSFVSTGIAYPALGNHDLDTVGLDLIAGTPQYDKFTYLPGNRRYYTIKKPEASLDIFVLNSGVDSAIALVEPDGNSVGSDQYNWFINELANSSSLFKIVMFHHPYISGVSSADTTDRLVEEMNWNFKDFGVDLILNGHSHTAQHIVTNNLNILDVSSSVRPLRAMDPFGTIYGSDSGIAEMRWAYADPGLLGDRLYAEIDIVGNVMVVSVNKALGGDPVYSFPITK